MVLWREGRDRLRAADPADRPALERVIEALVLELRRRLGGSFTTDELAQLYLDEGIDWCFDIAVRVAPAPPGRGTSRPFQARRSPATCVRQATTAAGAAGSRTTKPAAGSR